MRIDLDPADLAPIVAATVRETLAQIDREHCRVGDKLAMTEPQAAATIGVARHVLRDARLRGEIRASRVGKKIIYRRDELLRYLASTEQ